MPVFNLAKRRKRAIDALNSAMPPHERVRPSDIDGAGDSDLERLVSARSRKQPTTAVVGRSEWYPVEPSYNPYTPGPLTTPAPQFGGRWGSPEQTGTNNTNDDSDVPKNAVAPDPDNEKLEEAQSAIGERGFVLKLRLRDGQKPDRMSLPGGKWKTDGGMMSLEVGSYEEAIRLQRMLNSKYPGSMVEPA